MVLITVYGLTKQKKVVFLYMSYYIIKPDILVCATNNLESDCCWMERRMLYVNKWQSLDKFRQLLI